MPFSMGRRGEKGIGRLDDGKRKRKKKKEKEKKKRKKKKKEKKKEKRKKKEREKKSFILQKTQVKAEEVPLYGLKVGGKLSR